MNIRQQYAVTIPHRDLVEFLKERNSALRDVPIDVVGAVDTGMGVVVTLQEPAVMPPQLPSEKDTPF